MNEFEKWFEKEPTENEKGYCMIAWKAALEWALDHAGGNCDWDKIEAELDAMKK